jgi:hypothetical protein
MCECGPALTCLCHDPAVEISRGDVKQRMVRVGDVERDACSAALIDHHLHGRLSIDELERRQRAALAAVTEGDLAALFDDLPEGQSPVRRNPRRSVSRATSTDVGDVAIRLVPIVPVLGGAWFTQWIVSSTGDGAFLGALATGALGFASHAVVSRFRR